MGVKSSRNIDSREAVPTANDVLRDFDISSPTAAVIGAGIAGVHVAYEFAQLGFRVTVFDKSDAVAMGETQYALPFVGVGVVYPYLQSLRMARQLLRGTLSFAPLDITSDSPWRTFFSAAVHRWLWARRWSTLSGDDVMRITENLSRLSLRVVEDLAAKHKSLESHILRRGIAVGIRQTNGETIPLQTADPSPVMIDPVGWTSELAKISHEKFGVDFALGERLLDYHTCLRYDTEVASTLRFARKVDGHAVYTNRRFDVVVLAAGAGTGPLTWASSQMPIIGLSGCAVAIREGTKSSNNGEHDNASAFSRLRKALPAPFDLVTLEPRSHLLAYRAGDETMLQGLLSFDTTEPTASAANATAVLRRVETYLRAKCGIDVPLVQQKQQEQGKQEEGYAETATAVRYVRAYTPDGVPLVSHSGAAFNSFICAGFGDHAPDMAPAAAKVLAKLVELEALVMQRDAADKDRDRDRDRNWGWDRDRDKDRDKEMAEAQSTPQARVARAREELRLLLGGDATAPPQVRDAEAPGRSPLDASRFGGVVKGVVRDATHVSPLRRVVDFESRLLEATEPLNHKMNRYAINLARHDNMPDWLRTLVYYYFNDVVDDEELQRTQRLYVDGLRRVSAQYERKATPTS